MNSHMLAKLIPPQASSRWPCYILSAGCFSTQPSARVNYLSIASGDKPWVCSPFPWQLPTQEPHLAFGAGMCRALPPDH